VAGDEALRYDNLPVDDFLTALANHERNEKRNLLPMEEYVSQVMFSGQFSPGGSGKPAELSCYWLEETDPLSEKVETFVLFHTSGEQARLLKDISLSFKAFLSKYGVPGLFRIDPRYGLVCGSALEPIDSEVHWNKPGAYTALYLTKDPASPSLALLEYVHQSRRDRFAEIFRKYNGVAPAKPGLLATTWKRLRGKESGTSGTARGRRAYRDIKMIAAFLKQNALKDVKFSIIYKGRGLGDMSFLLDSNFATHVPGGNTRLFSSLGDLM